MTELSGYHEAKYRSFKVKEIKGKTRIFFGSINITAPHIEGLQHEHV